MLKTRGRGESMTYWADVLARIQGVTVSICCDMLKAKSEPLTIHVIETSLLSFKKYYFPTKNVVHSPICVDYVQTLIEFRQRCLS